MTEADVASPVHAQPLPARHYCILEGISRPNVLRIPCDGRVPKGYVRITGGGGQGDSGTQTLIRAGTRITRDVEVSSRVRMMLRRDDLRHAPRGTPPQRRDCQVRPVTAPPASSALKESMSLARPPTAGIV